MAPFAIHSVNAERDSWPLVWAKIDTTLDSNSKIASFKVVRWCRTSQAKPLSHIYASLSCIYKTAGVTSCASVKGSPYQSTQDRNCLAGFRISGPLQQRSTKDCNYRAKSF